MRGLAGPASLLALLPVLAAGAPPPRAATPTPTPNPPAVEHEQPTFRIAVPADWRRVAQDDCVKDPVVPPDWCYGITRFEEPGGRFFQVLVDYPPTEASAHAYWRIGPTPDGRAIAILEEEKLRRCPLTLEGEAACEGRGFSIAAWLELEGHHYLFGFGHARRRKGVDLAVFREVLASFRARPGAPPSPAPPTR